MATVTDTNNNNPALENPNKTLDPTLPDPVLVATETADDTDTTEAADAKTSPPPESGNDAPLSDIQKKIRRAERFGISVQLSEKEKRNSRAERSISNLFPIFVILFCLSLFYYRFIYPMFVYQILGLTQLSIFFTYRFGTGSASQGSEPSKSEELKRKARAERFHFSVSPFCFCH